ncbi:MAG TPA: type II toxin-antitoxin system RelE/ParE family toxin [Gemmatimonadota bacterium]|nr:type II toxin-antitoxin system RelE/ParE family toxin [Gemmatimonadota bacterium]
MIDFAFQVRWMPRAIKDLKRLPKRDSRRVMDAVERFARTNDGDVQQLTDVDPPEHRLRVGDYRVRFNLDRPGRILTVLRVLPRDKAYRVREVQDSYGTREGILVP